MKIKLKILEKLFALGCRFVLLNKDGKPVSKRPYDLRPDPCDAWEHVSDFGLRLAWEPASLRMAVIDMDGDGADEPPTTPERRKLGQAMVRQRFGQPLAELPSKSGPESGKLHMAYRVTGEAPIGKKADGTPYMLANDRMYAAPEGPGSGTRFDLRWMRGYCEIASQAYAHDLLQAARAKSRPSRLHAAVKWGRRHDPSTAVARSRPLLPQQRDPEAFPKGDWRRAACEEYNAIISGRGAIELPDAAAWSAQRIAAVRSECRKGNRHRTINRESFVAGLNHLNCPRHYDAVIQLAKDVGLEGKRLRMATENGYVRGIAASNSS